MAINDGFSATTTTESQWLFVDSDGGVIRGSKTLGSATTIYERFFTVTGIADAGTANIFKIVVPNANHHAGFRVSLTMGITGGKNTSFGQLHGVVSRISGANTLYKISSFVELKDLDDQSSTDMTTNATAVTTPIDGASGAEQSFFIKVTPNITPNDGSTAFVTAFVELYNHNDIGITVIAA